MRMTCLRRIFGIGEKGTAVPALTEFYADA